MKTLENITIERTNTHLERGTDGVSRQVHRTFKHKLNVKTINGGLRFVHLIVDGFIIQILLYLLGSIPFIPDFLHSILGLIVILIYPAFYAIMEFQFQQTPGKMLTGYFVINEYAEKPDFKTCLVRTLIRFVPFEALSCFGSPSRGWHDRWTKTYVVHKDEIPKLKALLEKHNGTTSNIGS